MQNYTEKYTTRNANADTKTNQHLNGHTTENSANHQKNKSQRNKSPSYTFSIVRTFHKPEIAEQKDCSIFHDVGQKNTPVEKKPKSFALCKSEKSIFEELNTDFLKFVILFNLFWIALLCWISMHNDNIIFCRSVQTRFGDFFTIAARNDTLSSQAPLCHESLPWLFSTSLEYHRRRFEIVSQCEQAIYDKRWEKNWKIENWLFYNNSRFLFAQFLTNTISRTYLVVIEKCFFHRTTKKKPAEKGV